MNSQIERQNNSTYFFSNIRATIVLLVILLHVVLAYSATSDKWWIIVDPQKTIIADIISGTLDIMLMAILFFIAGYFAIPSYKRCHNFQFLIKKMKSLMLPWLLGVLFLNPFLVNVIHFREDNHGTIFNNTVLYYRNFFQFSKMIVQDRSESPLFFSHYHLWFLSLLFYFFIVFSIYRAFFQKIRIHKSETMVKKRFIMDVILLIIISSFGYFSFYSIFENKWFVVSILQFQISRLIPYIAFFIFGIRSYENGWINNVCIIRKPVIHLVLSIVLTMLYLSIYVYVSSSNSLLLLLLASFLRYLICTYYLLIFLEIGRKHFNERTFFNNILTRNSFGVYIIHLNVTILFSIIFTKTILIRPEFKIILVFTLTVLASYLMIILYNRFWNLIRNFSIATQRPDQ